MCRVQGTAGGGNLRLAEVAWPAQGQVAARMQGQGKAGGGPGSQSGRPSLPGRGLEWARPGAGRRLPRGRQGPAREQCGLYPPSRRAACNMAPGPRRLCAGRAGTRAGTRAGPAPGVPLGPAAEWPDAPAASALSHSAGPPSRWWVWGSGPPASATSAILPAPMSIFQKFPVGGAEPQRPPLAPPSPGSQCQMRAGDKSSIFLVPLGWQQGLPTATWLLAALPPGARVAEAQAAPARTEGPRDGGGRRPGARGPAGPGPGTPPRPGPAGPALLRLPRGPAGPGTPCSLPGFAMLRVLPHRVSPFLPPPGPETRRALPSCVGAG